MKAERLHCEEVALLGCIPCAIDGIYTPNIEIHHVRAGNGMGQRDHSRIFGCCYLHHRGCLPGTPSIHGAKKEFESQYGTETELLTIVANMLANKSTAESSKILF